ncbi:MAG: endonuclease III [Bacteroides sp.]
MQTNLTPQSRADRFCAYFREVMPDPRSELHYHTPYELLLAVVLSAQCTDVRVNKVTPALFERFPDPQALAAATPEEILPYIASCSYPNAKANYLAGIGKHLVSDFKGTVPATREGLESLPGVGRKSASVVLVNAFNVPAFAVDTHVHRVAARLGLTHNARTPEDTERQVTALIPREEWWRAHHWLILHGRYTCLARRPKCTACPFEAWCPKIGLVE